MSKSLRVLIVEDSEEDALLIVRELEHGGYEPQFERVYRAEEMDAALDRGAWDLVIADYTMPHFSCSAALKLVQEKGLDLPFIVISGTTGEDVAVEAMKAGAHDYLLRGNLTRLATAVERELREAKLRQERKRARARLAHLNLVLPAIRAVSQHVTREKDRGTLIQKCCDSLIETRGYYTAWIAVYDQGGGFVAAAEAGLGEAFAPVLEMLTRAELPRCSAKVPAQTAAKVLGDVAVECGGSPVNPGLVGRAEMTVSLEHNQRVYGLLAVSAAPDVASDAEELELLRGAADDIAIALYGIEVEARHKRDEQALRQSEELFRFLVERAFDGINICEFDPVTLKRRLVLCNERYVQMSGYTADDLANCDDLSQLLTSDRSQETLRHEYDCIVNGAPFAGVASWKRPDCRDNTLEWSAVSTPKGDKYHVIGVDRDITERKHAEEALQQTLDTLRKSLGGAVQTIARTVEARDPYTAGHQRRVADLARAIATEMSLSQSQIDGMRMAGAVHDLGKMCVPAEILSKPARLTGPEFDMIKAHPRVGYDILDPIEFPWPVAQIVLQHHERMNGSGYPSGLSHDDILPEASIMGVADVVEAMASRRPYRPALGMDKVLDEILQNRDVLYDPHVADACLRVFEKGFVLQ